MARTHSIRIAALLAAIGGVGSATAISLSEQRSSAAPVANARIMRPTTTSAVYATPIAGQPDCFVVHQRAWNETRARFIKERKTVCS